MRTCRSCGRFGWALFGLLPAVLQSQPIYRCGNTYSQLPCPQAIVITIDDGRTPAQKAQTDAATVQATRTAERMEHDRLAQERRSATAKAINLGKAQPPPRTATPATKPGADKNTAKAKARTNKQTAAPDYFTASARADEPRKKAIEPSE